jgi:hypothetical protein
MPTIALANPRHKRRRRRPMTAKQAKYFGKRRTRRHARHHRRSHRRHAAPAAAPRRHRRRRHSFGRRIRRHARRFARHQGGALSLRGFNFNSFLRGTLVPSAVGAAGALGVDLMLGYATPFLPAALTTGFGAPLTRIAGAVALGMVASGVTKDRRVGEQVMAGAITVLAYGWVKDMVKTQFPSLPLSEYDDGVGAYVSGMGYAGPALAFPDRSRLNMYVGRTAPWNTSINARVAASRTVQPMGDAAEYTEGGYYYGV